MTLLGEIVENSGDSQHDLPYLLKLYEIVSDDKGKVKKLVDFTQAEVAYNNVEQLDIKVSRITKNDYLTKAGSVDDTLNAASEIAMGYDLPGYVVAAGINLVGYAHGKLTGGVFSEEGDYSVQINSINDKNVLNEVGMFAHYQTIVYVRPMDDEFYYTYAERYDGWNSALFNFHYQYYYRKADGTLGKR